MFWWNRYYEHRGPESSSTDTLERVDPRRPICRGIQKVAFREPHGDALITRRKRQHERAVRLPDPDTDAGWYLLSCGRLVHDDARRYDPPTAAIGNGEVEVLQLRPRSDPDLLCDHTGMRRGQLILPGRNRFEPV